MSNVISESLLSILKREDEAVNEVNRTGRWVEHYAKKAIDCPDYDRKYYEKCHEEYVREMAEWFQKLVEARADIRAYFDDWR